MQSGFGKRKQAPVGNVPVLAPPPPRFVRAVETAIALPSDVRVVPTVAVATMATPDVAVQPLVAYVFTRHLTKLLPENLLLKARTTWPAMPQIDMHAAGDGASVLMGANGVQLGATMFVAAMYPIGELQEASGSALGWPSVSADLNMHTAHAILSVTHPDPARAHMLLTALTVAVVEELDGSGVYWSSTDNLISAQEFLEHARLKDAPPAILWTKINLLDSTTALGAQGALAYTSGLSTLGFKDYECVCSREDLENFVFAFLRTTVMGAAMRGDQEHDGMVREVDNGDGKRPFEISYRHSTSIRPEGGNIIRLNLGRV
ncbi:MAG: hypothetical protein ABL898_09940 [Hyphomicrobiaceae bacterium]